MGWKFLLLAFVSLPAFAENEETGESGNTDDFSMSYETFGSNRKIKGRHTAEWTNWLTICDPVRMEMLQSGGMNQEPPVLASTIEPMWQDTYKLLDRMADETCYADLRA